MREELTRALDLLSGEETDVISFFDEVSANLNGHNISKARGHFAPLTFYPKDILPQDI